MPPSAADDDGDVVTRKREALRCGHVGEPVRCGLAEDPHLDVRRLENFVAQGMTDGVLVNACRTDIADARAVAEREAARRKAQERAEGKRREEGAKRRAMQDKFDRWWALLNGRREEVAQEALRQAPRFIRALIDKDADPVQEPRWRSLIYGKYEREIEKFMIEPSRRSS